MSERLADLAGTKPNPYPDEKKAFYKALAKAQGEFPSIPKDKTAQAGSSSYAYADLATILAIVRPILSKHGISIMQPLEAPNGIPSIRTELFHEAGESRGHSFPLGELPASPQQRGSLITYHRRYALLSILGLAADEDNDAQDVASAPAADPQVAEASPFVPPTPRQEPLVEDLTSAQRKKIFAIRTKLLDAGRFTQDEFNARLLKHFGVDSVSGLSKDQASTLITWLLAAEADLDKEATP